MNAAVLLWELATGGRPYAGVPKALLGHCIVSQQLRPSWPTHQRTPQWAGVVAAAEACWAQDPRER